MLVIIIPDTRLFSLILIISRILTIPTKMAKLWLLQVWPLSRDINAMVLRRMLDYVTQNGGRFKLAIFGAEKAKEEIMNAYAGKNRLILCGAHFPLNRVIHSILQDCGIPAVTVKNRWVDNTPLGWIWGMGGKANTIENSASVLQDIWTKLSKKYVLIILVDDEKEMKKSVLFCKLEGRQFYIAPNIFRFAAITETPVVFFSSSLSKGKIRMKIKRPVIPYPESSIDIEAFTSCFMEFVKEEMIVSQGFDLLSLEAFEDHKKCQLPHQS